MDLSREILSAETRFLPKLEEHFLFVFRGTNLESHDLAHHRRVWLYAKELLSFPGTITGNSGSGFVLSLLIACYLHDSGMSVDPGPRHGIHSRRFCEDFLLNNDLDPSDFTGLLTALENHDDKEYRSAHINDPLLLLLSVADDLDALGYTGIYRYLEIYIMRGIKHEELGDLILKNVTSRFNNLTKHFGNNPQFITRHQPRFEIIKNFCLEYNDQLIHYRSGTGSPAGNCGVAELIAASVQKGGSLNNLIQTGTTNYNDPVIKQYFTNLRKELNSKNNEF